MSPDVHIIRKLGYKGKQVQVNSHKVRLPCDAFTVPGALFAAARHARCGFSRCFLCERKHVFKRSGTHHHGEATCVLQIRSCSESMQKASLQSLETLLANACPRDMELKLLPNIAACCSAGSLCFGACQSRMLPVSRGSPQGKLKCLGHDVDLASWETFLKFVDWLPRPDNFQLAGSGGVACSLVGPGGRSSSLPHPLSRSSTQADPLPATCLD